LRADLHLALRGICSIPGPEWAGELLRLHLPVLVEASYFIDTKLKLHPGFPRALITKLIVSDNQEARREAILLVSMLGNRTDADSLDLISREDSDEINRELAKLGSERLRRPAVP
jgi:hypothetical protein